MGSAPVSSFFFAEYDVHLERRELLRNGHAVEIEPRAFDLLVFLIENRHLVVSEDLLIEGVWHSTYVSATSLARCVTQARRALGDNANRQRFIRTVQGHGYRFVADVISNCLCEPKETRQRAKELARTRPRRWHDSFAITSFIVITAVLGFVPTLNAPSTADASDRPLVADFPAKNSSADSTLDRATPGLMNAVVEPLSPEAVPEGINSSDTVGALRHLHPAADDQPFPHAPVLSGQSQATKPAYPAAERCSAPD